MPKKTIGAPPAEFKALYGTAQVWEDGWRYKPPAALDTLAPIASSARVYTLPQAAVALGVGLTTAKALVKAGRLETIRIGQSVRVSHDAVATFLADRERAGRRRK